jgi:hypothetical protein
MSCPVQQLVTLGKGRALAAFEKKSLSSHLPANTPSHMIQIRHLIISWQVTLGKGRTPAASQEKVLVITDLQATTSPLKNFNKL